MRLSEPPALAEWLLENARFENWSDALVGDLYEKYRVQRKSNAWYWRQVLAAVIGGFLREVRNHWVLAARAAFIGLEVSYAAQMLGHAFFVRFRPVIEPLWPVINEYSAWMLVSLFCGVAGGWVVGVLHRRHQNAMLLNFACVLMIWESIARFYVTPFFLQMHLAFVFLFYPSAISGIWISQRLLKIGRGSQTRTC